MILYILPTPMNKLDLKQRVSGWHFVPLERKAKQNWRTIVSQLKGKGIEYILCADLDKEAAHVAGDELHIPVRDEYELRRFNVGRNHAAKLDSVTDILAGLEKKWETNADVPIRGGDSLTSFMRRFSARLNRLLGMTGTALLVTDPQTIAFIRDGMSAHALVPNGNPVKRDKIYKVSTDARSN